MSIGNLHGDLKEQDLCSSYQKIICKQDLCSLLQVSVQDLHKRSPGTISVQDLYKSSVGKISVRDLMARSLYRSLEEVSWQDLLDHSLCKPAQSKCPQHRKSHFIRKFKGKMPRPRLGPEHGHTLCASLHSRNWTFHKSHIRATFHNRHQKSHFTLKLEYMSTFHKRHQKSHFIQKFTGKMPRPRWGPERGHTLCASLRSRNACPHVTRDIRRGT